MTKTQKVERLERALRRKRGAGQVTVELVGTYTDAEGRAWVELPDGRVMEENAYLEEVQRRGGRVIVLKWPIKRGDGYEG